MRENRLKERYQAGELQLGTFVTFPSPHMVEFAGLLGFDWVFIDAEHGPMDLQTCEQMVRAAETAGITPIIRLPYPDPRLINRYLDTGAMGILVPHLNSRELAEEIVAAVKYHPLGNRGAGSGTRAADYGLRKGGTEYAAWANSQTVVFGILEDVQAVEALPEILKVEGFDAFSIGQSDLSQSLGLPGQVNHPEVLERVDEMTRLILASDRMLCRVIMGTDDMVGQGRALQAAGIRMIANPMTNFLVASGKEFMTLK